MDFKEKFFNKYSIQCYFSLIIALLSLLSLTVPLLELRTVVGDVFIASENGFEFMSFKSLFISDEFENFIPPLGILAIFQLVTSIISMCITIFYLVVKPYKPNLINTLISLNSFFCILYAIEGIVFDGLYHKYGFWYMGNLLNEEAFSAHTLSYIPLIICFVLLVIYLYLNYYFNKTEKSPKKLTMSTMPSTSSNKDKALLTPTMLEQVNALQEPFNISQQKLYVSDKENDIELLKKYKNLLDEGILSQEEFNSIKQNILKKLL